MRAHAAAGEISCALREFERCRLLLADELGIDPSPPTRELYLTLLRSEGADTATDVTVRGDNWLAPGRPRGCGRSPPEMLGGGCVKPWRRHYPSATSIGPGTWRTRFSPWIRRPRWRQEH